MDAAPTALVARLTTGDAKAVARAISIVEEGGPAAVRLVAAIHGFTGRARLIGVTGPPGAGKSTIVAHLVTAYRRLGKRVAVLAVDPSSPFTGGAILGDRLRMQAHAGDPGVFIRSMASRGYSGGLASATAEAADVLDAAGFDVILIETVGVGQDEVDVARVADICVLVTVPEAGDDVQAMKAGVMEAADLFVVNKADREGADRAVAALEQMLSFDARTDDGPRRVVRTVATEATGIDDLMAALAAFEVTSTSTRKERLRARADTRLRELVARLVVAKLRGDRHHRPAWQRAIERIESRERDPYAVAEDLLRGLGDTGAIDHVGIATHLIDQHVQFFGEMLGLVVGPPEDLPAHGARLRFIEAGDSRIELLEPLGDNTPLARSLDSRGPGLHHVAVRVTDLDATLGRLAAAGVRLIDRSPRAGAHGTRVAFVHPQSVSGVLVELVERKDDDGAAG